VSTRSATHVDLAPGYRISRLIKGGWQLAGGHGTISSAQAIRDMATFVEAGITTFDCADIYTGVEERIGDFLRGRRAQHHNAGEQVRVHTKFVPDLDTLATLTAHDIRRTVERSRERLGARAIDLVQLHWWDFRVPGVVDAARYLAMLRDEGRIRQLGVTNFDTEHLALLLEAEVPLISHQVQYSLLDRRAAGTMASLCGSHNVGLLAFGAVAGGFLSEKWLDADEPLEPLENRSLTKYKLIIDEFGGWALFQELLQLLDEIARRHAAKIGTVAIRWVLDQPAVAAVIVGARHAGHLADTRRALELQLTDDDHRAIAALLARSDGPVGEVYALERDRDGAHGRIMRYNLNAVS
jgi:aryl-alcohol dehydrogenase-like predicted oxidoreductase